MLGQAEASAYLQVNSGSQGFASVFFGKIKAKSHMIFFNDFFTFRLQVSTFSYLCSGAYKGGLHNISNPKIDERRKHDKKS